MSEEQKEQANTEQQESTASSLADFAESDPKSSNEESEHQEKEQSQEANANEWRWSDDIIGDGEKPDWLKDRYKSVSDQAKAYTELEKKFGEFHGAPKDGYSFDDLGDAKDDPIVGHFAETFKDLNLSQQGFERVITEFTALQNNMAHENIKKTYDDLGYGAKQQINQAVAFANQFKNDVASVMKGWLQSADDVKAFTSILSAIPTNEAPSGPGYGQDVKQYETRKQINAEKIKNFERYKTDENYRISLDARQAKAVEREKSLKKA